MTRLIRKLTILFERIVKRLLLIIELFLFLRLLLKFLGASSQALIVNLIYKYSDILISPFRFIFQDFYWKGRVIELATISTMIGYVVLVFVVFKLLNIFSRD
jgi:hypothetical protein